MAKGVTKSTTWQKGDPRAVAAGKKSSRALSPELKELREQNKNELEIIIYKFKNMGLAGLKEEFAKPERTAIELLVIKCFIKAIEKGDFSWIEPMLARSIGKVVDKTEVDAKIGVYKLHDLILAELEGDEK